LLRRKREINKRENKFDLFVESQMTEFLSTAKFPSSCWNQKFNTLFQLLDFSHALGVKKFSKE
jgi:hypothetical protein